MVVTLPRYSADDDQLRLNKYPEKKRDEKIVLAVTRNKVDNILHWRIAWKATDNADELVGYRVLEVKHERGPLAGAPPRFQFRYSFRDEASQSAASWVNYTLGTLSYDDRENLVATASDWDYDGEGNCIACVKETIEKMVDAGAFGGIDKAEIVLRQLKIASNQDTGAGVDLFSDLHNRANIALEKRRAEASYMSKGGILEALKWQL